MFNLYGNKISDKEVKKTETELNFIIATKKDIKIVKITNARRMIQKLKYIEILKRK